MCSRITVLSLSVCLSFTVLTATYSIFKFKVWGCFKYLQCVAFTENALFKNYGVIYLPPLPSMLPDELLADVRNSIGFLSRLRISTCTFNDGFYKTTDSSVQRKRATKIHLQIVSIFVTLTS